jgi:hypothetical protein
MEFIIEAKLDARQAKSFIRLREREHPTKKRMMTAIVGGIAATGLCLFGLVLFDPAEFPLARVFYVLAILGILEIMASVFWQRLASSGGILTMKALKINAAHVYRFEKDRAECETSGIVTIVPYDKITRIVQFEGSYFVFFGDKAMAFTENDFTVGTPEEFRAFLTEKTGKTIESIK